MHHPSMDGKGQKQDRAEREFGLQCGLGKVSADPMGALRLE